MYQTKVQAVSGRRILADGKWLTAIGNRNIQAGDFVLTDGRCVYGHGTEDGTVPVIADQKIGIPFDSYYCYYIYHHGKLHYVADNLKGEYLLPAGNRVYYIPAQAKVIAANVRNGVKYTIAVDSYYGRNRWIFTGMHVRKNSQDIFSLTDIDLQELFQQEAEHTSVWCQNLNYEALTIEEAEQHIYCKWGFIKDENCWSFIVSIGAERDCTYLIYNGSERFGYRKNKHRETAYSETMYYYTKKGLTRLFHSEGRLGYINEQQYSERMGMVLDLGGYAQLYKTDEISGCDGIHFPIQDGYYYTMKAVPLPGWVFSLPQTAWITICSPGGQVIFASYFHTGAYFTICKIGIERYLLGIDYRRVILTNLAELVGDYPRYDGPYVNSEDIPEAGLYLCEKGKITLLKERCHNLRLQKLTNARNWQKKLIRLE